MVTKKWAVIYLVFYVMTLLGVAALLISLFAEPEILGELSIVFLILALIFIIIGAIGLIISYFKTEYDLNRWIINPYEISESIRSFAKILLLLFVTAGIYGTVEAIKVLANKI